MTVHSVLNGRAAPEWGNSELHKYAKERSRLWDRSSAGFFIYCPTIKKTPRYGRKCMRGGKPEHQQGQKCAAKNAKCKECHKIGHFYKVCQSKKRTR